MRVYRKFTEQQDNLICTFVKMYRFNVGYGLTRASEYLGIRRSIVQHRYYSHLREKRQIFSSEFGDHVIWNTRAISKHELEGLSKFEKIGNGQTFEEMDKRAWWKDE